MGCSESIEIHLRKVARMEYRNAAKRVRMAAAYQSVSQAVLAFNGKEVCNQVESSGLQQVIVGGPKVSFDQYFVSVFGRLEAANVTAQNICKPFPIH